MTAGERPQLLLYLARGDEPQRTAVAPSLAAAAARAGWWFDLYYDELRRGRHYSGNEWSFARSGQGAGGLAAGGGHAEQAIRLSLHYALAVVGDPESVLWPALEEAGVEILGRTRDPAETYAAVFDRLDAAVPEDAIVLDAAPQGEAGLVVSPFLYPAFLGDDPALGIEAGADVELRKRLERLGARRFRSLGVAPERAAAFPGGLDEERPIEIEGDYAALSTRIAAAHRDWGEGVLMGDPDLIAAQLPKAARLKLLPVYGRPQVDVINAADDAFRSARDPAYGRQFDDRDFIALAERGLSLDIVDPTPPFDATAGFSLGLPEPRAQLGNDEPTDAELQRWAEERRVLATVLLWSGMTRETDSLPRLLDLVAETGLRAGLVMTLGTLQNAPQSLGLMAVPAERGGVGGLLEPLIGSTGRGVGFEAYFPPGRLGNLLAEAMETARPMFPPELRPRGWWPLLDATLRPQREFPVATRGGHPVVRFTPRIPPGEAPARKSSATDGSSGGEPASARAGGVRSAAGAAIRSLHLGSFTENWRPFDRHRPTEIEPGVVDAARGAGFEYMWTKTGFGTPTVVQRHDDFVVLPFTAGNWDGWSPFFTVGSVHDLRRAERRLLRTGRPGWLASTIDGVLWALSGEVWARGSGLHRMAALIARGGRTGRLINVTPGVVARYARLLDDLERAS
jgi:hypothetical protein